MRRFIAVICVIALLSVHHAPQVRAGDGGGADTLIEKALTGATDPVTFVVAMRQIQMLVVLIYLVQLHRILFFDLQNLTHVKTIKPAEKKKNWSSSASEEEEELELPENSVNLGYAYNFNSKLLIVPPEEPVDPDPNFEALVTGKSESSVHLVEYYDKQNAEIFEVPSASLRFSDEGSDPYIGFRADYKDFDENMDDAEHLGDLSYGYDYEQQIHVFAIKRSF